MLNRRRRLLIFVALCTLCFLITFKSAGEFLSRSPVAVPSRSLPNPRTESKTTYKNNPKNVYPAHFAPKDDPDFLKSMIQPAQVKKNTQSKPLEDIPLDFGIVYFSYSTDENLAEKYNQRCLKSALSIQLLEPDIPITLITSHPSKVTSEFKQVFASVVKIPKEMVYEGRQWLTRVKAMMLSPYTHTLALDSDTFACAPFKKELKLAIKETDIDIAFNGHDSRAVYPTHPDCGIMVYKKGPKLENLVKHWANEMDQESVHEIDDQGPLRKVLHLDLAGVKAGRLSSAVSFRFRPAKDQPWMSVGDWKRTHDHSLVVSGNIFIMHTGLDSIYWGDMCAFGNQETRIRSIVQNKLIYADDKLNETLQLAHSQKECNEKLGAECIEMDWSFKEPLISILDGNLRVSDSALMSSKD